MAQFVATCGTLNNNCGRHPYSSDNTQILPWSGTVYDNWALAKAEADAHNAACPGHTAVVVQISP